MRKKFAFRLAAKSELFQAATGFSKSAFNEASAKLHADLEHAYQRWNELDA